jgi:hypothetical protein
MLKNIKQLIAAYKTMLFPSAPTKQNNATKRRKYLSENDHKKMAEQFKNFDFRSM